MSDKKTRVPIDKRPLVFLDTETTGLDPEKNEIIEIAILRMDNRGPGPLVFYPIPSGSIVSTTLEKNIVTRWSCRIKPQNIETADPKALEINGYADHPERWDKQPTFDEVAPLIAHLLHGCFIVGHNIKFDIKFLKAAFDRSGVELTLDRKTNSPKLNLDYQICTMQMTIEHLVPCGLKSASLVNVRKFMGWPTEGSHRAMKDVEDSRRLYHTLLRSSWLKRLWWGFWGRRRMRKRQTI